MRKLYESQTGCPALSYVTPKSGLVYIDVVIPSNRYNIYPSLCTPGKNVNKVNK